MDLSGFLPAPGRAIPGSTGCGQRQIERKVAEARESIAVPGERTE
jgi:hypothetical protein